MPEDKFKFKGSSCVNKGIMLVIYRKMYIISDTSVIFNRLDLKIHISNSV